MTEPPAPPPTGGSPQSPDWGAMGQKLRSAHGPNRILLIAGLLFFVDSFLPWYGASGTFLGHRISIHVSGWRSGGLAVLAIVLGLVATALAALEVTGALGDTNLPSGALAVGLSGTALFFVLLRWVTETNFTKYGLFVGLILTAVMTYAGYQKLQTSKT